jgi:hypothetical protein
MRNTSLDKETIRYGDDKTYHVQIKSVFGYGNGSAIFFCFGCGIYLFFEEADLLRVIRKGIEIRIRGIRLKSFVSRYGVHALN